MAKSRIGNDDASKRNLESSMRGVKTDNFVPVHLPYGAKTAVVRLLRALPGRAK